MLGLKLSHVSKRGHRRISVIMVKGMWYGLVENELPVIVSALGTELIYQPSGNYLQGIIN